MFGNENEALKAIHETGISGRSEIECSLEEAIPAAKVDQRFGLSSDVENRTAASPTGFYGSSHIAVSESRNQATIEGFEGEGFLSGHTRSEEHSLGVRYGASAEVQLGNRGLDAQIGLEVEVSHDLWHSETVAGPFAIELDTNMVGELMPADLVTERSVGSVVLEGKIGIENALGDELFCMASVSGTADAFSSEATIDGRCGLMAAFDAETRIGVAAGIERSSENAWFAVSFDCYSEPVLGGDERRLTTEISLGVAGRYVSFAYETTQ